MSQFSAKNSSNMAQQISDETKKEAMKVAKSIQKPGQKKEQTKLIAQGIEKGIAEYKKLNKVKLRTRDKQRKQLSKGHNQVPSIDKPSIKDSHTSILPWTLLALSWIIFTISLLI